jgi:hypothetical protein
MVSRSLKTGRLGSGGKKLVEKIEISIHRPNGISFIPDRLFAARLGLSGLPGLLLSVVFSVDQPLRLD